MPAEGNSVFRRRLGRPAKGRMQGSSAPEPISGQNTPESRQLSTNAGAYEGYRNAERDSTATSDESNSPTHPDNHNQISRFPNGDSTRQNRTNAYGNQTAYGISTRGAYPQSTGNTASLPKSEWLDTHTAHAIESSIDRTLTQWRGRMQTVYSDQVTPVRLASHFSVLVVAALILIMSQLDMPDWQFSLRALPSTSFLGANIGGSQTGIAALFTDQSGSVFSAGESLQRAAVPFTVPNAKPEAEAQAGDSAAPGGIIEGEIRKYTVQSGDTVLGIAERFGLQPETIQWANSTLEINPDLIRPGDELNILPTNGVMHTIRSGDTLSSIANRYSVTVDTIISYTGNGLPSAASPLTVGRQLVIPNGTKPQNQAQAQAVTYNSTAQTPPSNARVGSGTFVWPSSGPINQRYWSGHPAIDIGGWTGSPVRAADGGYVAVARGGWNGGYGNHVIIDHGNGFVTLYAHLNSIFVKPGESVSRGQQVGSVGNTGNSTGPHLHFEIRYQGVARNPITYLP